MVPEESSVIVGALLLCRRQHHLPELAGTQTAGRSSRGPCWYSACGNHARSIARTSPAIWQLPRGCPYLPDEFESRPIQDSAADPMRQSAAVFLSEVLGMDDSAAQLAPDLSAIKRDAN